MTKKKLFLSSWPHGRLIPVEVIEEREDMPGHFYIRFASGGTDTTTNNFLFDIPDCFNFKEGWF